MNILEYRRKALGYVYRADGDYEPPPAAPVAAAPQATTRAPAAPAAITGTHQELRENQEGTYYVEVPNTQAYLDTQNQKAAAAASTAGEPQAAATPAAAESPASATAALAA